MRRLALSVTAAVALVVGGLAVGAAPAQASHMCSTDLCYPDLCPQLHEKPYSIWC